MPEELRIFGTQTTLKSSGCATKATRLFIQSVFLPLNHRSLNTIPYRYKNERLAWEPMVYYGLLDNGEAFHNLQLLKRDSGYWRGGAVLRANHLFGLRPKRGRLEDWQE